MDWKGWTDSMATTFTRYHSPEFLSLGLRKGYCVSNKSTGHD